MLIGQKGSIREIVRKMALCKFSMPYHHWLNIIDHKLYWKDSSTNFRGYEILTSCYQIVWRAKNFYKICLKVKA